MAAQVQKQRCMQRASDLQEVEMVPGTHQGEWILKFSLEKEPTCEWALIGWVRGPCSRGKKQAGDGYSMEISKGYDVAGALKGVCVTRVRKSTVQNTVDLLRTLNLTLGSHWELKQGWCVQYYTVKDHPQWGTDLFTIVNIPGESLNQSVSLRGLCSSIFSSQSISRKCSESVKHIGKHSSTLITQWWIQDVTSILCADIISLDI